MKDEIGCESLAGKICDILDEHGASIEDRRKIYAIMTGETVSDLKLRLIFTVEYKLNGADLNDMKEYLYGSVDHAIQNGLLTGDSPAETTTFSTTVEEVKE